MSCWDIALLLPTTRNPRESATSNAGDHRIGEVSSGRHDAGLTGACLVNARRVEAESQVTHETAKIAEGRRPSSPIADVSRGPACFRTRHPSMRGAKQGANGSSYQPESPTAFI